MNVQAQLTELFQELESLLKQPDSSASLAELGVNTSIALVAAQGLHAYLRGDKAAAAEDLATAAEEVRARLEASKAGDDEQN